MHSPHSYIFNFSISLLILCKYTTKTIEETSTRANLSTKSDSPRKY